MLLSTRPHVASALFRWIAPAVAMTLACGASDTRQPIVTFSNAAPMGSMRPIPVLVPRQLSRARGIWVRPRCRTLQRLAARPPRLPDTAPALDARAHARLSDRIALRAAPKQMSDFMSIASQTALGAGAFRGKVEARGERAQSRVRHRRAFGFQR